MKFFIYSVFFYIGTFLYSETLPPGAFNITRIHYDGGGDLYADPSSLPNMLEYLKDHTNIAVNPLEKRAEIGDDIFSGSSFLYITGHGNIKFNDEEAQTLRDHLLSGAFLHADDNYGMDKSFRREMKKSFRKRIGWNSRRITLFLTSIMYSQTDFPRFMNMRITDPRH